MILALAVSLTALSLNPPVPPVPAPIESIADHLAADAVWIGVASAADLFTTSMALRHCPSCSEGNKLSPDVESRVALKAAAYPTAMGICYVLRRKGHNDWATGLRYGIVAALTFVSIQNATHAIKGR